MTGSRFVVSASARAATTAETPAISGPIEYAVEVDGDAPTERLAELVRAVDRIAEIPNSIRNGTEVRLVNALINGSSEAELT